MPLLPPRGHHLLALPPRSVGFDPLCYTARSSSMEPIATVRNATQTVKEFASKQEGQLARIEALVTACCILVGVLVLSNSRRRHESRSIPRLVIWAAFMFNYPVISYTVGLMQSSSIKNELFVVWACFLLLLLGSADTMTAFNFDDSSHQTRSMMNQGLHVIYLLLLILYYKGQLRHNFVISLFLLWALSVVRLGLRAWAYRSTCRSRGLVRENQIVHEYMKYEPLHSDGITGGTYDPKTMKGTIGQYFILDNTHPHWFKSFLSWISLQSMDAFLFTKSITLDDEVRHAVLRQLKRCKGKITDGRMSLRRIGVYDDDVLLGHTYARYILIWHVATSICSYDLDMENASEEVKKNHRIATKLSGYCMYLLAFQPDLIPDSTYTSLSLARGSLQNARDYLAECKSNTAKLEKLLKEGVSRKTDHAIRYISEGARVAIDLVDKHRFRNDEKRWKVLARFWANMMLYIAPSDRAVAHATKMATGGEFITIIWALLTHAHIVDKFQKIGGASGLHILIEEKEAEAQRRKNRGNQSSQPGDDFDYDGPALFDSDDEYSTEGGSLENC
ncbi:unnamed protein product [Urochloa decumbens]|uniref:DUF4220 domain-containing protein n=1 Tax=Urochloa decumbens TaxID=240449 RepID=A0ABC8ZEF6_9POAL